MVLFVLENPLQVDDVAPTSLEMMTKVTSDLVLAELFKAGEVYK